MIKKYQEGGNVFQQYIQDLLGIDFSQLGGMTSEGIAGILGEKYNVSDPDLLKPELFPMFSGSQLEGLTSKKYDPMLEGKMPGTLNKLLANVRKIKPTGFAGSGASTSALEGVYDEYSRPLSTVLGDIGRAKGAAQESALAQAQGWAQTISNLSTT